MGKYKILVTIMDAATMEEKERLSAAYVRIIDSNLYYSTKLSAKGDDIKIKDITNCIVSFIPMKKII